MALQLALIAKVNTDGPDVFLISTKGLGDVSNRAVAVLFDMAQDLVCKPLPNSWQLLFLVSTSSLTRVTALRIATLLVAFHSIGSTLADLVPSSNRRVSLHLPL